METIKKRKRIPTSDWPQKQIHQSILDLALSNVTKIEPRLHKINLSGSYNHDGIKDKLGLLKHDDNNQLFKVYDRKYIKKRPGFQLSIFVNPKKFAKPCFMFLSPLRDIDLKTHKDFLIWLDNKLPGLNVSSVEYAVDVFCSSPSAVVFLHIMIRKYSYAPSQTTVRTIGNGDVVRKYGLEFEEGQIENLVTHFGNVGKHGQFRARHKIYERGKDVAKKFTKRSKGKKSHAFWLEKDLDRLRFEFTAKRELKKHGIHQLLDLIENPSFLAINGTKWRFEQLKNGPPPWHYRTEAGQGYAGIFQVEYLNAKKNAKKKKVNQSRIKKAAPVFFNFQYEMAAAMSDFDQIWCPS